MRFRHHAGRVRGVPACAGDCGVPHQTPDAIQLSRTLIEEAGMQRRCLVRLQRFEAPAFRCIHAGGGSGAANSVDPNLTARIDGARARSWLPH